MKPRVLALLAAAALVFLMIRVATKPGTPPPAPAPNKGAVIPQPVVENPVESPPAVATPPPPATIPPPPQASRASTRRDLADPLVPSTIPDASPPPSSATDSEAAGDLDKITLMFRDYRTLTGENPVGTNAEIMKAIMGGNPKGAMLGPPDGQSLNDKDELIDRWGTPYFFHQLSKDLMEIHSAGPDRIMGTSDDSVVK